MYSPWFLALMLLAMLCTATIAASRILSATAAGLTFTAQNGVVRAQRAHTLLWTRQFPFGPPSAPFHYQDVWALLPVKSTLLVLTDITSPQHQEIAMVVALDARSGTTRWKHFVFGRPDRVWYMPSADVVLADAISDGAMLHTEYAGFRLQNGHVLSLPPDAYPAAASGPMLVLDDVWGTSDVPNDPLHLHYNVFDTRTESNQHVTFDLPKRGGCAESWPFPDEATTDDRKFTPERIIVQRRDDCGRYQVVVDWHSAPPAAVIEPVR